MLINLSKNRDYDNEVPQDDLPPSKVGVDSPKRDYLKAVSVPKKKTTRKSKRSVKDDGKVLGQKSCFPCASYSNSVLFVNM